MRRPIIGLFLLVGAFGLVPRATQAQLTRDEVRAHSDKAHRDLDREAGAPAEAEAEAPAPEPPPPTPPSPKRAAPPLAAPAPAPVKKDPGLPVTLFWHMADDADVYLNGTPLRGYEPSFRTRGDEAPQPAFSTAAVLRNGDIITVGGRRGGSYGFMLIAVDSSGRVVFRTDAQAWKAYLPGERADWFQPAVTKTAETRAVTVQPDPWYPQKELNGKHGNPAQSIWGSPADQFAHLYGVVALTRPD